MSKFGLIALLTMSGFVSGMASAADVGGGVRVDAPGVDTSVHANVSTDPSVHVGASVNTDRRDDRREGRDERRDDRRDGRDERSDNRRMDRSDRSDRFDRSDRRYEGRYERNGRYYEGSADVNVYSDSDRSYGMRYHNGHRYEGRMVGSDSCSDCGCDDYGYSRQTSVPDNKGFHGW